MLSLLCLVAAGGCPWFVRFTTDTADRPGHAAYLEHCSVCHGSSGRGDGSAAELPIAPADFSSGYFKLRSTRSGELPTDDDLFGTITRGIGGAGMPSFAHLPLETRTALVAEVKRLSRPRDGDETFFETRPPARVVEVPPRPALGEKTIADGRKLYVDQGCPVCHGDEGRGDGSAAADLKDYANRKLPPTNLTLGVFKAGADPRQLYLRIATGLNGTPMPEYGDDLMKPDERWALVEYLLTLIGR